MRSHVLLLLGCAFTLTPLVAAAECGWLLMGPPSATRTDEPISAWRQLRAFDSAETCEQFKTVATAAARSEMEGIKPSEIGPDPVREAARGLTEGRGVIGMYTRLLFSRCLPANVVVQK
jgi:hypothetical protein